MKLKKIPYCLLESVLCKPAMQVSIISLVNVFNFNLQGLSAINYAVRVKPTQYTLYKTKQKRKPKHLIIKSWHTYALTLGHFTKC